MARRGMARRGRARHGQAWHGMAWPGEAWRGEARYYLKIPRAIAGFRGIIPYDKSGVAAARGLAKDLFFSLLVFP